VSWDNTINAPAGSKQKTGLYVYDLQRLVADRKIEVHFLGEAIVEANKFIDFDF